MISTDLANHESGLFFIERLIVGLLVSIAGFPTKLDNCLRNDVWLVNEFSIYIYQGIAVMRTPERVWRKFAGPIMYCYFFSQC